MKHLKQFTRKFDTRLIHSASILRRVAAAFSGEAAVKREIAIMIKRATAAAVFGCIVSTASIAPAHANNWDYVTYPGSMCVRWSGPSQGVEPLWFSSIFNPSSSSVMYVDCPIVRRGFGKMEYSLAWVVDQNPSQNVRCSLLASRRTSSGFVTTSTANKYSTGSQGGVQLLDTGALDGPSDGFGYINWYLFCSVPPSASIVNYYSTEQYY